MASPVLESSFNAEQRAAVRMPQSLRKCCTGAGSLSWARVVRTRSTGVGARCGSGQGWSRTRSARPELSNLRSRYDSVTKEHPAWKDQNLSYQYLDKDKRNMSGVLAMSTLRRQLDMLRCQ